MKDCTEKDVPYKKFNVSSLNTERMNIFEVFIRMFIDEVYLLVRKSLKSSYNSISNNESFNNFTGSEDACALLFPMEYVFESYIAHMIRKSLDRKRFTVKIQDSGFYLFDGPRKFALRSDIVITVNKENGPVTALETK